MECLILYYAFIFSGKHYGGQYKEFVVSQAEPQADSFSRNELNPSTSVSKDQKSLKNIKQFRNFGAFLLEKWFKIDIFVILFYEFIICLKFQCLKIHKTFFVS